MTFTSAHTGGEPNRSHDHHTRVGDTLERLGIAYRDEVLGVAALSGGVSSDVFRVDLAQGTLCVKYALERLRVTAEWHAPLRRSQAEFDWLAFAGDAVPGGVPQVLAHDDRAHGIVMTFLDPVRHPVWKTQLFAGQIDIALAAAVGNQLGVIHALSVRQPDTASLFFHGADFTALRTDPYLRATAPHHPDLAACLMELADRVDETRIALVHGDVSPKNLLCGPGGPVFIDAECATFGDPSFDIAFLLNHLIIKALVLPRHEMALRGAALAAWHAYRGTIAWEAPAELEARAAALLPALMLARVDGKSPLEYLHEPDRRRIRALARMLLGNPPATMDSILAGQAGGGAT